MERKEIIKILSEYFETNSKYLGAPSFAYEIEIKGEIFTVGRYGNITTHDGRELKLDEIVNEKQERIINESVENLELSIPMNGHTGETLKNIVNMLSSKQHLIMKSLKMDGPLMDETFAEDLNNKKVDTVEDFKIVFVELGKERCSGLTFDFKNGIYTYNILVETLDNEKIKAFAELATHIDENAKNQKRTSYKPVQDDNPKYAFRTWLIRLGLKGKEYKDIRKFLLQELEGNGAFRKLQKQKGEII